MSANERNGHFKVSPKPEREPEFKPRRFKLSDVDNIIVETQEKAEDWGNHKNIKKVRDIAGKLIKYLPIEVKDGELMAVPLFSVSEMQRKCFGNYNPDRNGLGIAETVSVNAKRLGELEDNAVALILVMLLALCWRHQTGGSGNLDDIVRKKLRSFGLILGKRGIAGIDHEGKFAQALDSGGMGKPPIIAPLAEGGGNSSNRLWSCYCQRARVGKGKFLAHCPMCGQQFRLGDHVGQWPEGMSVTQTPLG